MAYQTTTGAADYFVDFLKLVGSIAGVVFYVALLMVWIVNIINTSHGVPALDDEMVVRLLALPVVAVFVETTAVVLLFYGILRLEWLAGKRTTNAVVE